VLYGIKPVVISVVLQALWGLARTALKGPVLVALGVGALTAAAIGVHELVLLAAAGAAMAVTHWASATRGSSRQATGLLLATESVAPVRDTSCALSAAVGAMVGTTATASVPFGLWPLFAVFLKIGAVLFGSGYVLLAFLRADLVERFGWLTERQLLDAVAVGQVTPGPVFTTATFIGYLLGGSAGALVATIGIFLPAFVFVALSGLALPRLRRSATAGAVLDGVNVASLALMAVVTVQLTRTAVVDPLTVGIALVSALALLQFRVNAAWLVVAGALIGAAATWLR
jgi:chromate transporter